MVMACATDSTFPYDSSVGPYPRIRLEDSEDWSPTPHYSGSILGIPFDEAETNELLNLAIDSKVILPIDDDLREALYY
jgi:hypothetical protein